MQPVFHYCDQYLLNPIHPISVNVIGAGGTGSHVLTALARLNVALRGLGHLGLHVTAYDDDLVSPSNVGRQMFSQADVGFNKAVTLVSRINRSFGTDWNAIPQRFIGDETHANITLTCVDTITARLAVRDSLNVARKNIRKDGNPAERAIYWMDFGNSRKSGQVVLGTVAYNKTVAESVEYLPDVFSLYPWLKDVTDDDSTPSCSQVDALLKQDLFINSLLAQSGVDILWQLFRELRLKNHGLFLNLETTRMNPIAVRPGSKRR